MNILRLLTVLKFLASRFITWRRAMAYRRGIRWMIWLDRALWFYVSHHTVTYHDSLHLKSTHPDIRPRFVRIKRANMRNNGPTCSTKRWWIYTRWGAYCVDMNSMFFS